MIPEDYTSEVKMRIHELAKRFNMTTQQLIAELKKLGIAAKSHMSSIDQDSVVLFEKQIEKEKKPAVKKEKKPAVKKKIKP
ncbi:MAG: translation initiation factor IF-2 N-terminal domain-containing protein, partial [Candidatus Omnitrophota bacterium]|nr:translation initiation factor IF-2 N-terminal domain-containing protein [Candidatus Omnitrophota bacterium]